jgi:hypothetical protein
MRLGTWMDENLGTQGYCLSEREGRRLRFGVRFSTGLCLGLVVTGLALGSAELLFALAAIGFIAGFTPRHPFDLLWNHGVRYLTNAPALPPNPIRRRHAFKLGAAWLVAVATLFAVGQPAAGLVLGVVLVSVCALVSTLNLCIPSTLLAWWERRRAARVAPA